MNLDLCWAALFVVVLLCLWFASGASSYQQTQQTQQIGGSAAITVGTGPTATYTPTEFMALDKLLEAQGSVFGNGTAVNGQNVRYVEFQSNGVASGAGTITFLAGGSSGPWWILEGTMVGSFGTTAPQKDQWSLYFYNIDGNHIVQVDLYTKTVKQLTSAGVATVIGTVLYAASALDTTNLQQMARTIMTSGQPATQGAVPVASTSSVAIPSGVAGVGPGAIPTMPPLSPTQCASFCQRIVGDYQAAMAM